MCPCNTIHIPRHTSIPLAPFPSSAREILVCRAETHESCPKAGMYTYECGTTCSTFVSQFSADCTCDMCHPLSSCLPYVPTYVLVTTCHTHLSLCVFHIWFILPLELRLCCNCHCICHFHCQTRWHQLCKQTCCGPWDTVAKMWRWPSLTLDCQGTTTTSVMFRRERTGPTRSHWMTVCLLHKHIVIYT